MDFSHNNKLFTTVPMSLRATITIFVERSVLQQGVLLLAESDTVTTIAT